MTAFEEHQNTMDNCLEINSLCKSYKNITAVKKISFNIEKNQTIGLLGPNGCGKTTTIGMILGLLKPTSGTIKIENKDIENHKIETLKKINFISPYIELPKKLTVKQNLNVYARLYGIKDIKIKIDYLCEKLRLNNIIYSLTGELSSGQKK